MCFKTYKRSLNREAVSEVSHLMCGSTTPAGYDRWSLVIPLLTSGVSTAGLCLCLYQVIQRAPRTCCEHISWSSFGTIAVKGSWGLANTPRTHHLISLHLTVTWVHLCSSKLNIPDEGKSEQNSKSFNGPIENIKSTKQGHILHFSKRNYNCYS